MEGRNERQAGLLFINEAGAQRDGGGNSALSHQREVQDKLSSGWHPAAKITPAGGNFLLVHSSHPEVTICC